MFKCSFNDCDAFIEEKGGYCNGHNVDPEILRSNRHLFQKKINFKAQIKYLRSKIKEIEDFIDIKNAPPKCRQCNTRVHSIMRSGKQINPNAMYDAAETIYEMCPSCDFIYGYTY